MDEDDLDLPCPPAPYLPSCSNFHSPSPVSLSQHRFRFTQSLDADCETPVFQQVYTGGLGFGGNMLGLFIDAKDMEKGVLQAAIERIEYATQYSSVFEEEDEGERLLHIIQDQRVCQNILKAFLLNSNRQHMLRPRQPPFLTTRAHPARIRIHLL
jgi:hypothetical protein